MPNTPSGLHPQNQPPSGRSSSLAHLGGGVDIFPAEDPIAEGRGGVVVDELEHFEAGHACGLQHSPALSLIEEGWHGDHRVFDGLLYRGQQNGAPTSSMPWTTLPSVGAIGILGQITLCCVGLSCAL